ncbi:uncharacterized protein METZ01_LOCUS82070 [marine metagenome]|uniref:Uncharacterized protein n=1 Tax=marine metagenome TaxID=408172 RepID=A0A381UM20_9ZZZZ
MEYSINVKIKVNYNHTDMKKYYIAIRQLLYFHKISYFV